MQAFSILAVLSTAAHGWNRLVDRRDGLPQAALLWRLGVRRAHGLSGRLRAGFVYLRLVGASAFSGWWGPRAAMPSLRKMEFDGVIVGGGGAAHEGLAATGPVRAEKLR